MKKLIKVEEPAVLVAKGEALYQAYLDSGGTTRPWSHKDIKAALVQETGGNCAYCEGEILAVSYGDVEHILPKDLFPEKVLVWNNLTLACSRCNGSKSSKYDAALEFVNPYVDRIEDHLLFLGAFVYDVSDRGFYTVEELKLNDAHRVENRALTLRNFELLVRRYEDAPDGYIKAALLELIRLSLNRGEYTAATRGYLSARSKPGSPLL